MTHDAGLTQAMSSAVPQKPTLSNLSMYIAVAQIWNIQINYPFLREEPSEANPK